MLCTFKPGCDRCTICGVPSPWPGVARNCRPRLGDMIHAGLGAIGITPERVAAALGLEDCGCEERRQLANELGHIIGFGSPPTVGGGGEAIAGHARTTEGSDHG